MTKPSTHLLGANDTGLLLSADLMSGAEEIAVFLFGSGSETNRRKVYHAADKLGLPCFKIGGTLCARRSTILGWIEKQESAA